MRSALLLLNIFGLVANIFIVTYFLSFDFGFKWFNVFAGCFSIIAIFSLIEERA
jgi:hypothetical protein